MILSATILLTFLSTVRSRGGDGEFLNELVAYIPGGHEKAQEIAKSLNYQFKGQVSPQFHDQTF